jgi:hypothetical protein
MRRAFGICVVDCRGLFAEFREKRFVLLWRGSRDGFEASDFHTDRGYGREHFQAIHAGAVGYIRRYKPDPSLISFVFTLANLHNFPARKCGLKAEKKSEATRCHPRSEPTFLDIRVSDPCNSPWNGYTQLGLSYANDTGMDRTTLFTGSLGMIVKGIEVFEITN